jgi:hypothetical protein
MVAVRKARVELLEQEERWTVHGVDFSCQMKSMAGSAEHVYDGERILVRARSEACAPFLPFAPRAAGFWARRLQTLGVDSCTWTRSIQFLTHAFLPGPTVRDRRQWCILETPGPSRMTFFSAGFARHLWPRMRLVLELALMARAPVAHELPARLPVVFGHGTAGILFHEVLGHPLEADIVRGTTYWKRIGEAMGPAFLTVADDPLLQGLPGSRRVDDEGVPAARRVLMERGVLKDLLCDLRGSDRLFLRPGCARVSSIVDPPVPRISNTVLDPDPSSPVSPSRLFPRFLFVAGIRSARFLPPDEMEVEAGPAALAAGGEIRAVAPRLLLKCREEEWLGGLAAVGPRVEPCLTFGWCAKDGRPIPVGAAAPWVAYPSLRVVAV